MNDYAVLRYVVQLQTLKCRVILAIRHVSRCTLEFNPTRTPINPYFAPVVFERALVALGEKKSKHSSSSLINLNKQPIARARTHTMMGISQVHVNYQDRVRYIRFYSLTKDTPSCRCRFFCVT